MGSGLRGGNRLIQWGVGKGSGFGFSVLIGGYLCG
jgi:hypothetical protein